MQRLLDEYRSYTKEYKRILGENTASVKERNLFISRVTLFATSAAMMIALIGTFLFAEYEYLRLVYIAAVLLLALLFVPVKLWGQKIIGWYIYFIHTVMIAYAICSSALLSPEYVCVTILFILFEFPILYLDSSMKINIAILISAVIYLSVIVRFKDPSLISDEIINVCCFSIFGGIIGMSLRFLQLRYIDMKNKMQRYAYHDQLTGLYNRRKFFEQLAESEREECSTPYKSLAMIDIDHFKKYNDTFGHQAGDACLKTIAALFTEFGHKNDLEFFRYGGEEFVAADKNRTENELLELCENLRCEVAKLTINHQDGGSSSVTISAGVAALKPDDKRQYETLISYADKALYYAKQNGRNQIADYESIKSSPSLEGIEIISFRRRN